MPKACERGVVSFPKAGRTWIRLFFEYYLQFTGLRLPKVAFAHDDRFEMGRRVVLLRHPCDVMVSFHFHMRIRRSKRIDIGTFIRGQRYGVPAFNQRYSAWSERTQDQLVIRYEDLFGAESWRDLLAFFDIPYHEEGFGQARASTRFDTIRANLEQIATFPGAWRYLAAVGGHYGLLHPKNPDAHKFRRGVVGGYVDYLGQEDIDYILGTFTLGENFEPYRRRYLAESEGQRA